MPAALLHTLTRWLDLPVAQPGTHLALQPGQEQPVVNSQRKSMSASALNEHSMTFQMHCHFMQDIVWSPVSASEFILSTLSRGEKGKHKEKS